ncbi:ABC transporter permease [Amycolatopsis samaneae]
MLRLVLASLRSRLPATVGALCTAVLATVLVGACGILFESTFRQPAGPSRGEAADLVVQAKSELSLPVPDTPNGVATLPLASPPRLGADVLAAVAGVSGVLSVTAETGFTAVPVGAPAGRLPADLGGVWAPADSGHLVSGRAPVAPDELVADVGSATRLGAGAGGFLDVVAARDQAKRFRVVGLTSDKGPKLLFTPPEVERLLGPRWIDRLAVRAADPGVAERIAERVRGAHAEVLTGLAKDRVLAGMSAKPADAVGGLASSLGGFALVAAVFVVSAILALAVSRRRREFALLRAIGASARQVRWLVGGEALGVSLLALAIGLPLAVPAADVLIGWVTGLGIADAHFVAAYTFLPFLCTAVLVVSVVQLAASSSARYAARTAPTEAMREAAVPARGAHWLRVTAGIAVFCCGVALTLLGASLGGAGGLAITSTVSIAFLVAFVLLGPVLARPVIAIAGGLLRSLGSAGLLARAEAAFNLRQFATTAVPIALAVGVGCSLLFNGSTEASARAEIQERTTTAELVVTAGRAEVLPGMTPAISAVPGVTATTGVVPGSVVVDRREFGETRPFTHPAIAMVSGQPDPAMDPGVVGGSLSAIRGDTVGVSAALAASAGWNLGDEVHAWNRDGTSRVLRIGALFTHSLGLADFIVPVELAFANSDESAYRVLYLRSPDPDATARRLEEGPLATLGLSVQSRSAYLTAARSAIRETQWAGYLVVGIVGVYAAVAVANALVTSTLQRRAELSRLQLLGARRRQLVVMVGAQACLIALFGVVAGTFAASAGLVATARNLSGSWVPVLVPGQYLAIVGCAFTLTVISAVLPALVCLRERPSDVARRLL